MARLFALLLAALSFFAAAPSSADVLWVFNGDCWGLAQVGFGGGGRPIDFVCSTLPDPSVHVELLLPSDGLTWTLKYSDHAAAHTEWVCDADGPDCHFEIILGDAFSFEAKFHTDYDCGGSPCNVYGTPDADGYGFISDGRFLFGPRYFTLVCCGSGSTEHIVGAVGSWSVAEPNSLAILGLGLAGLGFSRRRKQ